MRGKSITSSLILGLLNEYLSGRMKRCLCIHGQLMCKKHYRRILGINGGKFTRFLLEREKGGKNDVSCFVDGVGKLPRKLEIILVIPFIGEFLVQRFLLLLDQCLEN